MTEIVPALQDFVRYVSDNVDVGKCFGYTVCCYNL